MQNHTLNAQQKKAVEYGTGPLLIIAGAGTGKTTVITERIKYLILKKNIIPKNILALTFTEKAASEMQERVDVALPYGYADMWIHTFHAFCDRILKENAHYLGLDLGYKLLSQSESLYFLQTHIFDLGLKSLKPLGKPSKFLDAISSHFSRLADEDITPDEYLSWIKKQDNLEEKDMYLELATAYKKYEELKIKNSVMDFSDLITYTLLLFRTRKNILKKYQKQFDYIFVDEFQDTNYAQNELAILLAGEKENITVVADDDQSIYRFRGAAVSNVMQFTENFPKAYLIPLTKNYRSTQVILDSAYSLIQRNNPNRLEVQKGFNKKLQANSPAKNYPIELLHTNSSQEEAESIVKNIQTLVKNGYSYKDIAILVRANNHADETIAEMQRNKIPYRYLGPEFLFHQEEIKDLIAYALFLSNISDSVSLYRVLSMNIFDLSILDLNKILIAAKKENKTLFEEICNDNAEYLSDKTKGILKTFREMVDTHLELTRRSSAWNVLYNFLKDTGVLATLNTINSVGDEKRVKNIIKFFDRIKRFEKGRRDTSIFTFVEWVLLMLNLGDSPTAADDDNEDENSVNALTIHASKGLEFGVVFLINLVSERFPTRERSEKIPLPEGILKENLPIGSDFHIEEERRLFYVGITRAKERLFFTASNYYGEGKRIKKLSPFIFEAKPDIQDSIIQKENIAKLTLDEALSPIDNSLKVPVKSLKTKVTYVTFSNLQNFDVCPLHYKAKVILKIPTPPTANQSSGISIHKTLQQFYQRIKENEKPTEKDMLKILEENWIQEGYANKTESEEGLAGAKQLLKDFYKKECNPPMKPLALELQFNFLLKNGVKASGTIDRIDKKENGIEIIDYKTGENNPGAKKAHEEQLALYALAATRIQDPIFHYKPEEITLTIHFLKGNVKKSIHLTKEDLEKYENKLMSTISEIEKSDFSCNGKLLCKTCEYKMLCQAHI